MYSRVKSKTIPGIMYQNKKLRFYPLRETAAQLIGYTRKVTKEDLDKHPNLAIGDSIGKAGLEMALDKKLAQEALEMGEETFRRGLDQFIFEEELDLSIAMKPAQISNNPTFGSEILLTDTGYGRGELLISPIFQNEGKMVYPVLLADKVERKTKSLITSSTANEMEQRLKEVVSNSNGTAHSLFHSRYELAAKTGTAEMKRQQGKKGMENSFLLVFETAQDRFLLSLVENYTAGNFVTQSNKTFIEDLYEYLRDR